MLVPAPQRRYDDCYDMHIVRLGCLCWWFGIKVYRSVLQVMPAMESPRLAAPAAAMMLLPVPASDVVR